MPGEAKQGALFEDPRPPEGTLLVNDRCVLRTRDEHRLVLGEGVPLAHYALGDRASERSAIVSLVEQGWASQVDAARAFGCTTRTVRRLLHRFVDQGLVGLVRGGGYPKGRSRLGSTRVRVVHRLKAQGESNRVIAARLGVTENAIRKLVRRLGWREEGPKQGLLDLVSTAV